MPSHPRLIVLYLGLGLLLAAAFFLLPEPFSMIGYMGVSALPIAAILIGLRLFRPAWLVPWLLLTAGQAGFLLGDTIWYAGDLLGIPIGPSSIADFGYLAAYPLLALGVCCSSRPASRATR